MTTGERVDGGVYVEVGGRRVWHFQGGDPSGAPTVLLHGAFGSASSWGTQIADFTGAGLSVFLPERSGHGHSPDHDGPFSYADMVDETIAYLETAVRAPAHLVGWSDGAVIALLVALQRPDLVNRTVLVTNYLNPSGQDADEFFHLIGTRDPGTVEFLRSGYVAVSPDGPEHFDVVYDKTLAMLEREPDYDLDRFAGVAAPTLVVAADRGVIRLEHVLALSRILPRGRLAVLPGTHILPVESPELFNPLVISFLAADPPSHWTPTV
ncbi:Putative non-heme bromoperoxidase BpoC [Gordonia insulae]|uniref:Non-heme bromoperoxidase BpoC n=1 Tax=Gordonia insulae TaxID=2420509 RepID=A0A3G8JS61_9ACTN|nr:Putative non-heme bromoperoxidase BpoC [Gordonia insulae]